MACSMVAAVTIAEDASNRSASVVTTVTVDWARRAASVMLQGRVSVPQRHNRGTLAAAEAAAADNHRSEVSGDMAGRALVCGAGIGGLTTGIMLRRLGWDVTVFERDSELRTAGAGLNLWPNGVRVLKELGLGSQYERISSALHFYRTFSSTGEVVAVDDVRHWPELYGASLSGVYRRDLSRLLADALGTENLSLGRQVVSVEQDDKVTCRFVDGEVVTGDLLIGADGVQSAVRTSLYGQQQFSTDRLVRWRGLFDLAGVDVDPLAEGEVWGPEGHFGYLPIGNGRAYWFSAADQFTDDPEAVLRYFGSWAGGPVPGVIAATPRSTLIRNELHDFQVPLPRWSTGCVTLVGDAAHPMLPGMAQGANQALEDVKALGWALEAHDDVERALKAYEERRIPWVGRVVRASRSLFEFEDNHGLVASHRNPLLGRYERIIEGPHSET